jgi:hypothetical protein
MAGRHRHYVRPCRMRLVLQIAAVSQGLRCLSKPIFHSEATDSEVRISFCHKPKLNGYVLEDASMNYELIFKGLKKRREYL